MAIIEASPWGIKQLYHGSPHLSRGKHLLPGRNVTAQGDKGKFVFGAHDKLRGMAYLFRSYMDSLYTQTDGLENVLYSVLLSPTHTKKHPDDPFAPIQNETHYLVSLSPDGFKPVLPAARMELSAIDPAKWVKPSQAKIIDVEAFTLDQAVREGVQVFYIPSRVSNPEKVIDFMSEHSWIQTFSRIVKKGYLSWVNQRPEYDDCPTARPSHLELA